MLYDNRKLGRVPLFVGLANAWHGLWRRRHKANLDLLSLSPHLQRDLGLDHEGSGFRRGGTNRK